MTEQEYLTWLAADQKSRVLLVEAVAYSDGQVVTRYMSTSGFVSEPSDSPANIAYDDIVVSIPQFTSRMSEQLTGQSTPSWGDIDIINENGDRDSWLEDAWDGRSVKLYLGDKAWPKSDFRKILDGTIADIYAKDQRTLSLKVRDKQWALNVPIQTSLIGGSNAAKDQPKPLSFGFCRNVTPVLINDATSQYQVHDGAINSIVDVYDNGVSVGFTASIATGTFTLTSAAAGHITADVQGAKPGGVYLETCADIMEHLITTRSVLTSADLDADSFDAFNTTAPQPLNLYIPDRQNLLDRLDQLIRSVGGWYGFSRDGLMQLGRLQDLLGDYLELPGDGGDNASTPDSPALDIIGGLKFIFYIHPNSWRPSGVSSVVGKYDVGQKSYLVSLNPGGNFQLNISADGVSDTSAVAGATASVPDDGLPRWGMVTYNHNNGSGNSVFNFYTSLDTVDTDRDSVSWTPLGAANQLSAVAAPFAGTASLEVGTAVAGLGLFFAGKIHKVYVYNDDVGGTLVASMVAADTLHGDTSWVSTLTGETWTTNGDAIITGTEVTGTAVIELTADDLAEASIRCLRRSVPAAVLRLGHSRNYTVQTDGLAGAVTEARRAELAAEYLVAKAADSSINTAHPLALEPDLEGTLLSDAGDGEDEARRRLGIFGMTRAVFGLDAFSAPFRVNLGDVVQLTHPRFGFSAGKKAVVVGIVEQPTKNRMSLEIWK